MGGAAKEGWRYDRTPELDLILFFSEADFDGASGATVLIPSPVGTDGLQINQLCGAGQGMCNDLQRFGATSLNAGIDVVGRTVRRTPPNPGNLLEAREEGRSQITRGVTTDDNRVVFANPVTPTVQIYGLDRAAGGASRLVVAFAIPGDQITGTQPPAAGGRTVYPIRISLMATVSGSALRFDLDTVRNFAVATPLERVSSSPPWWSCPSPLAPTKQRSALSVGGTRCLGPTGCRRRAANGGRLDLSSIVLAEREAESHGIRAHRGAA